eukprot:4591481-Pyramimonas_sp.AAC.1
MPFSTEPGSVCMAKRRENRSFSGATILQALGAGESSLLFTRCWLARLPADPPAEGWDVKFYQGGRQKDPFAFSPSGRVLPEAESGVPGESGVG